MKRTINYSGGILEAHEYLLAKYPEFFVIGQGLWAPWYVGNSMKDLDKKFGTARVIDSPVSELAVTGAAVGASLNGYRALVVHPRLDFMLLAVDQIVTQAAKWSHMFGGQASSAVTIRGIINRGGEQGAQHSQALYSWFAHIPGLRVVMPATAYDARELLVASVLSNDPVLYIDDRWLYEREDSVGEIEELSLSDIKPQILRAGSDFTIVGAGYSTLLALQAADILKTEGINAEVIDLRVINPMDLSVVSASVQKTGRICALDIAWSNCGLAAEVISRVTEGPAFSALASPPIRITLPDAPAPTSKPLEQEYYPDAKRVAKVIQSSFEQRRLARSA